MFGRRTSLAALTLLQLAVPGALLGQALEGPSAGDSVRYLGGITVSVARPALTTGGSSAVVVDLDSLGHAPAPSMEDVVRALPLVQVRSNSRGEAQPALRGSQNRQIAVLVDGVPLTLGWDHRVDLSVIPLTAARTVTLVRGLASVLYGPNTLGGVIDVDLARSGRRVQSVDPVTVGFSLDETGGTRVSASAGRLLEGDAHQWVFRAGAGFEERPGVPLPGGAARDSRLRTQFLSAGDLRLNSDVRRADAFLTSRYRSDAGAWASVSATATDVERGVPPEAHQDAPRLWRYPEQRRFIGAATAGTGPRGTPFGSGELEASLGVDLGSTLIEQFGSEAYRVVSATENGSDRVASFRLLGAHEIGGAARLQASATLADIAHDETLSGAPRSSYRQRMWSLGTETAWSVGGAGRTTLSVGAAVDGASTPETGGLPPRGPMSDFGVRAGASSLLTPGLLLHGGVSRRARFPSLRELYSTALGRFEPNLALGAETLVGSELGMTARAGAGELQLVGFHHRLRDGIVRTSVIGASGNPAFMRVNQAHVRSTGVELLVVGEVGRATLTGDLTLQRVRGQDDDGTQVSQEYEPSVFGEARLDVPLVSGLRGTAEIRYVGAQECQNPEVGGLQRLGASRTVDVTVRRSFEAGGGRALGRLTAEAAVWNATDAATFQQCGLPSAGRVFQVQVRVF